jgi:gliding motility-associated-like protein
MGARIIPAVMLYSFSQGLLTFSTKAYHRNLSVFSFLLLLCLIGVTAYGQPVADFTASKNTGCSPLMVKFTNTSTGATTYSWNFGNGNTSTFANPSASFINPGTYTVSLTATGANGSNTITKDIRVWANPKAAFTAGKAGGCVNDSICFSDLSTPGSVAVSQWSWDFGDGNNSSAQYPPCNRYTFSDVFKVTLVVTDGNGCQSTLVKPGYITISDFTVQFTQNKTTGCEPPLEVTFRDTTQPPDPAYIYAWSMGNGDSASGKVVTAAYPQAGKYNVTLKVTAPNGCSRSFTKTNTVTIHAPRADFIAGVATGCAPFSVGLQNISGSADTSALSYEWKTSAGHQSAEKSPVFVFTAPGKYTVSLKVTAPGGCEDSVVKTNYITVNTKTPVELTTVQTKFCSVPATVTFNPLPAGLSNVKWIWSDATVTTEINPVKVFSNYGSYSLALITQNTNGCFDTVVKPDYIRISRPGFTLSLSAKKGCRPLSVTMMAADTSLVPLTNWQWSLDNIPFAITQNTTRIFTDTGVHVVRCIGTNPLGCTVIVYDTIKVGMETHPSFTTDKPSACFSDGRFVFTNHTNDSLPKAEEFNWNFRDASVSVEEHPVHRYTDTGLFKVTLYSVLKGCTTVVSSNGIRVNGPKANFNVPVVNCFNDSTVFTNTSKGGNKWQWTLGDGTPATTKNVKHQYGSSGTFDIVLIAQDTLTGCMDTASGSVTVPQAPTVNFAQTDIAGCPGFSSTFSEKSVYGPGTVKAWQWKFGDGQEASGAKPQLYFNQKGYHYVKLTLIDLRNCAFSFRKDSAIHVYGGAAAFTLTPEIGCMPLAVTVSDQSVSDFAVVNRKWVWGTTDSITTTNAVTSYTYTKLPADQNAGFTVQLTISDTKGCKYLTTRKVRPAKPVPAFTTSIIKRCGYDSVMFVANQSASAGIGPFSFTWDLGDGDQSNLPKPVKKYTSGEHSYMIRLVVKDSNQCADSALKLIHINTRTPVAGFLATPEGILDCPGPPIFFTDTTIKGATGIFSWLWDFGDSTKSVLRNPAKTYLIPGIYDLRLTITDSLGCVSTVFKPNLIKIAGPVASYTFKPLSGCAPLSVAFKATSSNTRKFEWDLGDGMIDTNAMHTYAYTRPGVYIPNLTIEDSAGCKRALPYADTIKVFALPKPDFETDKSIICKGSSIAFNNLSAHDKPITAFVWNIGAGKMITQNDQQPFSHAFYQTGTFTVRLRATDALGCTDSIVKTGVVVVTDDTIAPAIPHLYRASVTDNQSTVMEFSRNNERDFLEYVVYYNYNASGQSATSLSRQLYDTVFTQAQLNTLNNSYSYAVAAKDVCLNVSKLSPVHSTIELTAKPEINAIRLDWNPYKGWKAIRGYEVYRLNTSGTYEHIKTVSAAVNGYLDTSVQCLQPVFYKIKAVEENGFGMESWSDTSGARPVFKNTLPSTQNIRATVTDNKQVRVEWQSRQHREYFKAIIYRSVDDQEPVPYQEVNAEDTVLVDKDVDVANHTYAYTTYLRDNCGGVSVASNVAKTILLKIELKENDQSQYNPELSWNRYAAWNSGVEKYDIEFRYDSLREFSSIASTSPDKLRYFDQYMSNTQTQYCYRITAYQKDNSKVFSESNVACVATEPKLYAPSAFTVNGDNLNETFKLGGIFLEDFTLKIFNRYGELVFESHDMNTSWDGTYKGNPAPADVYVFMAEGRGRNGKLVTVKGTVTLIR